MADIKTSTVGDISALNTAVAELEARLKTVQAMEKKTYEELVVEVANVGRADVKRLEPLTAIFDRLKAELVIRRDIGVQALDQRDIELGINSVLERQLKLLKDISSARAGSVAATDTQAAAMGISSAELATVRAQTASRIASTPIYSGVPLGGQSAQAAAEAEARAAMQRVQAMARGPVPLILGTGLMQQRQLLLGPGAAEGAPSPPPPASPRRVFNLGPAIQEQTQLRYSSAQLAQEWQNNQAQLTSLNNTLTKHGYLTSEVISAAQRGELTYAEWGNQIAGTAAKFGAWTAVSIPIFGAIDAFKHLYDGATQTSQGIAYLQRSISGLNAGEATAAAQKLSQQFNVPIKDAFNAVGAMSQIYHNLPEAAQAAQAPLFATKLDVGEGLDATTAARRFTAIAAAFRTPASELLTIYSQVNEGQRRWGSSIGQTSAALATAGGAWHAAGGNLQQLLSIIIAANRQGAQTSSVATGLTQAIAQVQRPVNAGNLRALGLDPTQPFPELLRNAVKLAGEKPVDVQSIGLAFGNARLFRSLIPIFNNPQLLNNIETSLNPTQKLKDTPGRELGQMLAGANQQIERTGVLLQNIGSSLLKSGGLDSLGLLLQLVNHTLVAVNDLVGAFNSIPDPFRSMLSTGLEMLAVWRGLKALNVGQGIPTAFGGGPLRNADGALTFRGQAHQLLTPNPDKAEAKGIQAQAQAFTVARTDEYTAAASRAQALNVEAARASAAAEKLQAEGDSVAAEKAWAVADELARQYISAQATALVAANVRQQYVQLYDNIRNANTAAEKIAIGTAGIAGIGGIDLYARPPYTGGGEVAQVRRGEGSPAAASVSEAQMLLPGFSGGVAKAASVDANLTGIAGARFASGPSGRLPIAGEAIAAGGAGTAAAWDATMQGTLPAIMAGAMSRVSSSVGSLSNAGEGPLGGGSLMGAGMTYLISSTVAQVLGGMVGGKAGHSIGSIGQDAAIGAGIGTILPIGGPVIGGLLGGTVGILNQLSQSSGTNPLPPSPGANTTYADLLKAQKRARGYQETSANVFTDPIGVIFGGGEHPLTSPALQQTNELVKQIQANYTKAGDDLNRITPQKTISPWALPSGLGGLGPGGLGSTPFSGVGAPPPPPAAPPLANMPKWLNPRMSASEMAKAAEEQMGKVKGYQAKAIIAEWADQYMAYSVQGDALSSGIGTPKSLKDDKRAIDQARQSLVQQMANASPQSFLSYYSTLTSPAQSSYDTVIKDAMANGGLGAKAPGGQMTYAQQAKEAAGWDERQSAAFLAKSLTVENPKDKQTLVLEAAQYAKNAHVLTQAYLDQNTTDLANALAAATNPAQLAQAFKTAEANAKSIIKYDKKKGTAEKIAIAQQSAQSQTQLLTDNLSVANAQDPNAIDTANRNLAGDQRRLQIDQVLRGQPGISARQHDRAAIANDNISLLQAQQSHAQSQAQLSQALAGNNIPLGDQRIISGIQQQISLVKNASTDARTKAEMLIPLEGQLAQANLSLYNDTASYEQNLITATGQLTAGVGNDPTKIAAGVVSTAKKLLAFGHFKTPADKANAEYAVQQAHYNAQSSDYSQLQINLGLAHASLGQQIVELEKFARKIKGNKALYQQVLQQILSDETAAAGSYELNVGNIALPTAYNVRRAEHALKAPHDQQNINHTGSIIINVHGVGDAKQVGEHVVKMLDHGIRSSVRASQRSSGLR